MTDLFIAGAFWDHRAPVLFHREDMLRKNFQIRVIADITCDIEGSIPSTKQPSTMADPVYDYDAQHDQVADTLYQNPDFVSVMAVDNLPSELPRDASEAFGENLLQHVLPSLFGEDHQEIITTGDYYSSGSSYRGLPVFTEFCARVLKIGRLHARSL